MITGINEGPTIIKYTLKFTWSRLNTYRVKNEIRYKIHANKFKSLDLKLDKDVSKRTSSGRLLKFLEALTSTLI